MRVYESNINSTRPVVLHVSAGLDFGGVETQQRLIAATPSKHFEHRFCAIMRGGVEAESIAAAGGKVSVLNIDPWRRPLASVHALLRLIRQSRPQVVHSHGMEANLFGLLAAWLGRVPVRIGEEIGIPDHSAKARLTMSAIYRTAHRVIGVSDAVRQWLVETGEVPSSKAIRLYNPAAMSDRCASPRQPGQPLRIAFLGRLHPIKNLPSLIDAMGLIPADTKAELLIIGEGEQRSEIERQVKAANLQDRVHFHGFSDEPDKQLSTCHLYAQPSLAEGFGIALVEAMSCGLPAIVTNHGGMPEVVQHGRTGWVLRTADPDSIATAIVEAANLDRLQLADMGRKARSAVQERFSASTYVSELERLYETARLAEAGDPRRNE